VKRARARKRHSCHVSERDGAVKCVFLNLSVLISTTSLSSWTPRPLCLLRPFKGFSSSWHNNNAYPTSKKILVENKSYKVCIVIKP